MNHDDVSFVLEVPFLDSLGHDSHQAQRRRMMVRPRVPLYGSSEGLFLCFEFSVEVALSERGRIVAVFIERAEVEDAVVRRVRLQEAEHVGPAANRALLSLVVSSKWGEREMHRLLR